LIGKALLLFVYLLWMVAGPMAAAEPVKERLEQERGRARALQEKIQGSRLELERILKNEKQAIDYLNRIDRQLNRHQKDAERLQDEIAATHEEIKKAKARQETLHQEVQVLREAFQDRILALYKTRKAGYPALVLSAENPQEAYRRYYYLLCIVKQDAEDLERLRSKVREWEHVKAQHQQHRNTLLSLQEQKVQEIHTIRVQREQKKRLIAALQQRKGLQEAELQEMQNAAAALQSLIRSLEKQKRTEEAERRKITRAAPDFGSMRGKLPYPVEGKTDIRFGKIEHPLLKTFTVHNGIEIRAPEGKSIRAIYPGFVVFSGWLRGYGNVLIIDHGNGYYTLSGHASRLLKDVGEPVQTGETVAYVGDTGSLRGPSLYFEIRKAGKPVDPLKWIRH
jgi:septal ring factor EnvC (AmiA/AmiB activator)